MLRIALGSPSMLLFAAPAFGGGVAIFHGAPGATGDVYVHDEATGVATAAPGLTRIRLETLDFVGRTALSELAPNRPRYRADVPFTSRLALQDHGGSLYAFSRSSPLGPTAWGFFHVAGDGSTRVVIELPALAAGADPFLSRVAVAPDGRALLVATLAEAGGDLYEIDLTSGAVLLRTATIAPLHFSVGSLLLESAWGCGVSSEGVWRFQRLAPGDAQPVGFGAAGPAWFQRQIVASENGEFAATVAGESPISEYAWVFGRFGDAVRAATTPDRIAPAGFAPEVNTGPWLAVSNDGACVAWRSETSTSGYGVELYLAEVGLAANVEHVTRDEVFEPYIDEIGQFAFGAGRRLMFLAGDASSAAGAGVENADAFSAELTSGVLDARNLTATSGQSLPPFTLYGSLAPERALWLSGSSSLLLFERTGATGELLRVSDASGVESLLDEMSAFEPLGCRAGEMMFATPDDDPETELEIHGLDGTSSSSPDELAQLDYSEAVLRSAIGAADEIAVASHSAAGQFLWRVDLASGEARRMSARSFEFGPAVMLTAQRSIAFSIGAPGSTALFCTWPLQGSPRRIASERFVGALLPAD